MRPRLRLAAFALAGAAAALAALPRASETALGTDPVALARRLDRLGDRRARPLIPGGAHRTPFGLQLHPSCFRLAAAEGFDRARAAERFDAWAREAFEAVARGLDRYPELSPYLLEWISQARRAAVTCTRLTEEQLEGYGAHAYPTLLSAEADLRRDELAGLDTDPAAVSRGPLTPLFRVYRPVIAVSQPVLRDVLSRQLPLHAASVLVHEVLHATGANNLERHGPVEKTPPDPARACHENILDDRVNVIAYLCTGVEAVPLLLRTAEEALSRRMATCGPRKGCEELFENRIERGLLRDYIPSETLEHGVAALCGRIRRAGWCQATLRSQGPLITRDRPPLRDVGRRLNDRLDELLPRASNDIPASLLRALPAHRERLERLSGTACFEAAFTRGADGTLFARGPIEKRALRDAGERVALAARPAQRLSSAREAIQASARCAAAPAAERDELWSAIAALEGELYLAFSSDAFGKLAAKRFVGEAEADHELRHETISFTRRQNGALRALVGPALFAEYLGALRRGHHQSPDFDCALLSPRSY
jgi:hypothetical protein